MRNRSVSPPLNGDFSRYIQSILAVTIGGFLNRCSAQLAALYSKEEISSLAAILLKEYLGVPRYILFTDKEATLESAALKYLEGSENSGEVSVEINLAVCNLYDALFKLATGMPVQYVLGYQLFCGHRFSVNRTVLIPRPETEELVKLVEQSCGSESGVSLSILDVCTGSGSIAWSLSYSMPNAFVAGCDISREALKTASGQSVSANVPLFFECDVLESNAVAKVMEAAQSWDVIVSNPPYVCEEEKTFMHKNVLEFEPAEALFVSDSDPLLFYNRIAEMGLVLLRPGGKLFFEINERFGEQIVAMLRNKTYICTTVSRDINGKERFVSAVRG